MENSFEKPDLELMLRGRPTDLPALQVRIVGGPSTPSASQRFVSSIRRNQRAIILFFIVGALLGLLAAWIQQPYYEAHGTIEVGPSDSAEAVAARMLDPALIEDVAGKTRLNSLPEYSGRGEAAEMIRTVLFIHSNGRHLSGADLVRHVSSNLEISPSPQGHMVNLAFKASDPQRAALFLNTLSEDFRARHATEQTGNTDEAERRLSVQIEEAKQSLDRAQSDLIEYAKSARLAIDPQTGALLDGRFTQVQNDIARLRQSASEGSAAANEAARLADAVRRAEAEVATARAEQVIRYEAKRQDVETKRAIYESLLRKTQEAIADANLRNSALVIIPAQVPMDPMRPNRPLYTVIGMAGGLLAGICFGLFRDARNRTFRKAGDIAAYLHVPELGTVPTATLDRSAGSSLRKDRVIDLNPTRGSVKWQDGPDEFGLAGALAGVRYSSDLGESFRSVLASIWIAGQKSKRPRVLLFSSPGRAEGKTTMVTNLGIALANTNRRVLIVEADLRQPRLYTVFGTVNDWGLANMLEEDIPVEDYAFENLALKTDVPGLYMLPAGSGELNVASMRYIERLTELLLRFRLEFHAVLIDTPAALQFPDARVIGRLSDAAILVFRCGQTNRNRAAALYRRFQEDGINVLGAVLNDCARSSLQ